LIARRLHTLVVLTTLLLPVRVAAQAINTSAPTPPDSTPFNIATIDPETFRALALRVPDGLAPTIDGRLDDEVWSRAPVAGNFVQREPNYGQPSSEPASSTTKAARPAWTIAGAARAIARSRSR